MGNCPPQQVRLSIFYTNVDDDDCFHEKKPLLYFVTGNSNNTFYSFKVNDLPNLCN